MIRTGGYRFPKRSGAIKRDTARRIAACSPRQSICACQYWTVAQDHPQNSCPRFLHRERCDMAHRPTIMGTRHMVAACHYLASEAGFKILEAGVNAIDAGVAAGIA